MSKKSSRKQAGFTLLELMVALTTGIIVVAAAYGLAGASSRQFQLQQRISTTQSSVRMALDQMQRDIERAGYLGPSNSAAGVMPSCEPPVINVQAIQFQDEAYNGALGATAAFNDVDADAIALTGSYATPDQFLVAGLGADGTGLSIQIQTTWQAARRNFVSAAGTDFDADAVAAVFVPGRVLALRSTTGNMFLREIAGAVVEGTPAAGGSITVRLTQALPIGSPCLGGLAGGAVASVLSRIQYAVEPMGAGSLASLGTNAGANAAAMGTDGVALVRREIAFDGAAIVGAAAVGGPAAPLERVVLEYLAEVNYDFMIELPGTPPRIQRAPAANAANALTHITAGAATPQLVRSVIVTLSGRTAERDPRFPEGAAARNAENDPLSRFGFGDGLPGASRVRTVRAEISLPNVR